jgi:DNA-binding HxlR family transcriptional regulator
MKRTSLKTNECPVARSLDCIGDWWSLLIIRDAFDGLRRFGEFQRSLGVVKNILTARLRQLVADGLLEIVAASENSRYGEYVLTARGRDLFPVIVALRQWGESHFFRRHEAHSVLVDRENNRPVRKLEVLSKDGRVLKPADTIVRKPLRASVKT